MEKLKEKVKQRKTQRENAGHSHTKRTTKCASWDHPVPQNSFVLSAMSQLKCTAFKQWKSRDKTPLQPKNSYAGNTTRVSAPHSERGILPFTYWQNECKPLNHNNNQTQNKTKAGDTSRRSPVAPVQYRINSYKLGLKGISPVCYYRKNEMEDHELSLSEITHMDIKPIKKNVLTFQTQPNKRPSAAGSKPRK